jgi:ABC-type transport system involved in multi-copper enzyme maturation permease subunit
VTDPAEPAVPAREPLHARVAGWLERAFNPIMVKELRASLRGARFFIAHLTILSIFACGLLLTFAGQMATSYGAYTGDPSRVGRGVFLITQLLHLAVVFLVVPGLAATSITAERDKLTHELLLSTTMTARQIIWGKFTAAMTQTFTIFVSMVPLVGLCFLFGGITVYQIVANYAFLFGLSALVIAFALNISASARSTQRAVGTVYGLAILGALFVSIILANFDRSGFLGEMAVAYGFLSGGNDLRRLGVGSLFERVMYVHVMPGFVWAALMTLFFLTATNRLKPIFANRSTPVRIFFAVAVSIAGLLTILTFYHELPPSALRSDRSIAVMSFAIASLTLALLSALFACEDPILPPHLQAEVSALRGPRRLLRCFWPGATSGAVFSVAFNAFFLALSFAAFVPYSVGFNAGPWVGLPAVLPTATVFVVALLWSWLTSMYARFLGITLASRPVLLRTILVLTCLFVAIFPLIHWGIAASIDRDDDDPYSRNGPVTLGLSPAAAVVSALDLSTSRRNFPANAGGIPIPLLFSVFALAGGAVLCFLGNRADARLQAEYQKLREQHAFE